MKKPTPAPARRVAPRFGAVSSSSAASSSPRSLGRPSADDNDATGDGGGDGGDGGRGERRERPSLDHVILSTAEKQEAALASMRATQAAAARLSPLASSPPTSPPTTASSAAPPAAGSAPGSSPDIGDGGDGDGDEDDDIDARRYDERVLEMKVGSRDDVAHKDLASKKLRSNCHHRPSR